MNATSPVKFLEAAYDHLGYRAVLGDRLLDASAQSHGIDEAVWTEKGDWLALAKEVKAERIFFLENNPVIVFARLDSDEWNGIRLLYNRIWSMARPRLLFLATPGELAVYDLAHRPLSENDRPKSLKPLGLARSIADVAEQLARFARENIESGRVFEVELRFGDLKGRADKQLIHDLKAVRRELIDLGLRGEKLKYAHALIGRSIFIRYLEDRGVLTEPYFRKIARGNHEWQSLLKKPPSRPGYEMASEAPLYPRVLGDKDFTYALFDQLATDFNGDMFPDVGAERDVINSDHLHAIQDLMYGEVGPQPSLFFQAYDFKIVPIELVSAIYEEFFHEQTGTAKAYGAFYTPPALAEFVVSQALPTDRLSKNPRVLDPACGSGIFLVESFRRIVRYRTAKQKRRLRFDELRKIVRDQIAGIDVTPEAIRVAAFSLYLAMLHYLEPPDILEQIANGNRLPNLVVGKARSNSLNVLLAANAFDIDRIESDAVLKASFGSECADVVVGNPPWGSPGRTEKDKEARQQNLVAMRWCDTRALPVGDQERSQAFVWRARDLLKPNGTAGLLLSTGVFFKHHENSVRFRRNWLERCALHSVFNFAHCRHVFFNGVDSPFALAVFGLTDETTEHRPVQYWSAKRTKIIEGLQGIVFARSDLKQITRDANLTDHWLWKALWWGDHRDLQLVSRLRMNRTLGNLTNPRMVGQGYKKANQQVEADWLKEYKSLPVEHFKRYGRLNLARLLEDVPDRVERRGVCEVYDGLRLLVQRGIEEKEIPRGQTIARLEDTPFCFTNAISGVKLPGHDLPDHEVVLGVFWSSLARYFFFLTTANWGIWHHEIERDEVLSLPIRLPDDERLRDRITTIVDKLRSYDPPVQDVLHPDGIPEEEIAETRKRLEAELDDAIFELYGLDEAEIDLIRDMCNIGIDFFYKRDKSVAVEPFLSRKVPARNGSPNARPEGPLGDYIRVFMRSWTPYLDVGTELHWEIHVSPRDSSMLAVVFEIHEAGDTPRAVCVDEQSWDNVLKRLDVTLPTPISSRIYIEGLARAVSEDGILIIKRNERRLWTKSMAREDAEATLVQAMQRKSLAGDAHS